MFGIDTGNTIYTDGSLAWVKSSPGTKRGHSKTAIGRMVKAEISKRQGIHTVSCLADLSCFYDTVTWTTSSNLPGPSSLCFIKMTGPVHWTSYHPGGGHQRRSPTNKAHRLRQYRSSSRTGH